MTTPRAFGLIPHLNNIPTGLVPHIGVNTAIARVLDRTMHALDGRGFDPAGMIRAGTPQFTRQMASPATAGSIDGPMHQDAPNAPLPPLFDPKDNRPHSRDVMQGSIGDCYFDAAEASVADTLGKSGYINNMIHSDGTGGYDVSINDFKGHNHDVDVSLADVQAILQQHPPQTVLWPAVLEAAEARIQSGTDADSPKAMQDGLNVLNHGGFGWDGLRAMTGQATVAWDAGPISQGLSSVMAQVDDGKPVVMDVGTSTTPVGVDPHKYGLSNNHVYDVVSMHRDEDGTYWALVDNPWGFNLKNGDDPNGGSDPSPYPDTYPGGKWLNLGKDDRYASTPAAEGVEYFTVGGIS
ncbi:C2 family cysteine protease [Nocardia sp. NPDC088792]|uniref:C2 family cysteine protease n=1 Tax=Nocardia sp. NPDC088792 TaxID=3364332 RepID=UPI00382A18F5